MKIASKTTIAVAFNHSFKTVEAELVDILGIPCGVHRSLNKSGWAVSALAAGLVLGKGPSRVEAIAHTNVRVAEAGADKVLALLAKYPAVPSLDGLEAYVAPVKVAPTINPAAICEALAEKSGVDISIIRRVICSKGKNAGRLLGKCPSIWDDKEAAAVWLGIQPNPFKVSVGKVLFLDKVNQELALRLGKIKWPSWLDSDRAALESFGVW